MKRMKQTAACSTSPRRVGVPNASVGRRVLVNLYAGPELRIMKRAEARMDWRTTGDNFIVE